MTKLQALAEQLKEAVEKMTPDLMVSIIGYSRGEDASIEVWGADGTRRVLVCQTIMREIDSEKGELERDEANMKGFVTLRNLVPPLLEELEDRCPFCGSRDRNKRLAASVWSAKLGNHLEDCLDKWHESAPGSSQPVEGPASAPSGEIDVEKEANSLHNLMYFAKQRILTTEETADWLRTFVERNGLKRV